jgi:hypothetical protein
MEETCSLYLLSNSFYGSLPLLVIPPGRKKIVQYAMRCNMNWKLVVISCERLIVQSNKRHRRTMREWNKRQRETVQRSG